MKKLILLWSVILLVLLLLLLVAAVVLPYIYCFLTSRCHEHFGFITAFKNAHSKNIWMSGILLSLVCTWQIFIANKKFFTDGANVNIFRDGNLTPRIRILFIFVGAGIIYLAVNFITLASSWGRGGGIIGIFFVAVGCYASIVLGLKILAAKLKIEPFYSCYRNYLEARKSDESKKDEQ